MRLFRLLLWLYPASFRAEYGGEMRAVFAARGRRENAFVLWTTTIGDVVVNATGVHAEMLWQDVQWSLRVLRKSPGFTVTAVVVAALGMGVTTATFALLNHVLLRPLPFPDPEQLVVVYQTDARGAREAASPPNFEDWRTMSTSFSAIGAHIGIEIPMNLSGRSEPIRPDVTIATSGVFEALGVAPAVGRGFTPEDDREEAARVALLSDHLASQLFGGAAGAIGQAIRLDSRVYDVIGVMPPGFAFPSRETDLWIPGRAWGSDRGNHMLAVVARLRSDVSITRARAEMDLIANRLQHAYPKDNDGVGIVLTDIRGRMSPQSRVVVLAVFGAAFCLMLIACTNVANLLFARATTRRQEMAVRIAIGAARERLLRQLLTESVVLAIAGGVVGLLLAALATPALALLVPSGLPTGATPDIDWRVFTFAAALMLGTTVVFGAGPALRASRKTDVTALRARSAAGGRVDRLRAALVLAEVVGTVVLLVSAGLLLKAMWRVQAVDAGFRAEGVLTLRTTLPISMPAASRRDFYSRVLSEAQALPGVTSAAYISFVPMTFASGNFPVTVPGATADEQVESHTRFITPGYFGALGIPLVRGRVLSDRDDQATAPRVVVIGRSLAERLWPGRDAIGRQMNFAGVAWDVVGVVGDVAVRGLEQPGIPQSYFPADQIPRGMEFYAPKDLVIRTTGDPAALATPLRRIVHDVNPEQAVSDVRLLEDIVASQTASRRAQFAVLATFAGLAFLLAAVGVYGLLSFAVSMRTQEIGVRMALGAGRQDVLAMFLRQGVVLGAAGVLTAVPLAYAAGRGMTSLLFGVHPGDPLTYGAAALLALLMTLFGSLRPALRAAGVDPVITMRSE